MKSLFFIGWIFALSNLCMSFSTAEPTSEIIYQYWTMIGESESMIEVSARVLKCDPQSTIQLHLEIFNEGSDDQTAHFKIILTNPATNAQEVHEISFAVVKGVTVKPKCENSDLPALRISLPANWDPTTVKIALTFIP